MRWTNKREAAALALAAGYTMVEAANMAGVTERTLYRWKNDLDFDMEVDRLTLLTGIASRAERLRIATRAIRQNVNEAGVKTGKDLLDWLKFAQSETDGAKFDITALFEAMEGAEGDGAEPTGEDDDGRNQAVARLW